MSSCRECYHSKVERDIFLKTSGTVQYNNMPVFCLSTASKNYTMKHYFVAMITLPTTTHYIFTFEMSGISSNSVTLKKLTLSPDKHIYVTFLSLSFYSSFRMILNGWQTRKKIAFKPGFYLVLARFIFEHHESVSRRINTTLESTF